MNSKQLHYFVAIVETGSFTAAAQALGLSQPPLSKQIMALEEELGVCLLTRGSRKAEPTPAGAFLYDRAKNILGVMEATEKQLRGYKNGAGGILRLGTISSSGHMLTEDFLKDFCLEHPGVRFELTEGNTYQLLEHLKNGLIECAILRTPFNSEGFRCCYGPKEPLVAVGMPRYFKRLQGGEAVCLSDLVGKPLIYYRRFDSIISAAFQNIGAEPDIFCRNDDARTCLLWAGAGLGVALVPETICNLSIGNNLDRHPLCSESTSTQMVAVYKKSGYVSPIAREFVSYFQEYMGWKESPLPDRPEAKAGQA